MFEIHKFVAGEISFGVAKLFCRRRTQWDGWGAKAAHTSNAFAQTLKVRLYTALLSTKNKQGLKLLYALRF